MRKNITNARGPPLVWSAARAAQGADRDDRARGRGRGPGGAGGGSASFRGTDRVCVRRRAARDRAIGGAVRGDAQPRLRVQPGALLPAERPARAGGAAVPRISARGPGRAAGGSPARRGLHPGDRPGLAARAGRGGDAAHPAGERRAPAVAAPDRHRAGGREWGGAGRGTDLQLARAGQGATGGTSLPARPGYGGRRRQAVRPAERRRPPGDLAIRQLRAGRGHPGRRDHLLFAQQLAVDSREQPVAFVPVVAPGSAGGLLRVAF